MPIMKVFEVILRLLAEQLPVVIGQRFGALFGDHHGVA